MSPGTPPTPPAHASPVDVVAGILADHGIDRPDFSASLTAVGGTSLLAMRLVETLGPECGLRLPLSALLDDRPLADAIAMAEPIDNDAQPDSPADSSAPTPGQRGIWTAEQIAGSQMYALVFTAHLDGPHNPAALREAVEETVARHDGLRTIFPAEDEELRRRVLPDATVDWEERDAPEHVANGGDFRSWASQSADAAARRRFQPEKAPPLRFLLLRGGPEQGALAVVTHHLLLDAWAIGLLLREVLARYRFLVGGPRPALPPAVPAAAQARHHRILDERGELRDQLEWWLTRLATVAPVVDLPSRRERPSRRSGQGRRYPFAFDAATSAQVRAAAHALGVTPFSLLLTAFAEVVGGRAQRDRLMIGVPIAGRGGPGLSDLVAQCARVVPVVIEPGSRTPADAVRRTQARLAAALDHPDVPLEVLAPALAPGGDSSRNPLVQFVCGDYSALLPWHTTIGPLRVDVEEGHGGGSPMDVTVAFTGAPGRPADCYGGTLEFALDAMTPREARDLLDAYLAGAGHLAESLTPVRPPHMTS